VEPYLWTAVVGGNLLLESGSPRAAETLPKLIEGKLQLALAAGEEPHWAPHRVATRAVRQGGGFVLSGAKTAVFNGPKADQFIVSARTAGTQADRDGISLFLVEASARGLSRADYKTLDDRLASNVTLDGVRVSANDLIGELDNGFALLESAADRAIAAQCSEAVGSMTSLIETTAAYLRTRSQYGSKLADFQALQHRMADMYASTELARSMTYVAMGALTESARERARQISAAKIQVGQGLRFVTQQAVQLHGGMGMSEELSVGHHFKRATLSAPLFGDETFHLDRFRRLSGEPRND
jgi:alkylation response protein AidB-like acyl-CoA dehydrogenase